MTISNINSIFHQLDLSLLRHFFAVASYGGFSKASRATGISQPGLSLGLQKLEKALGTVLIDRESKQFALTEAGITLFAFCQRLEGSLESVVNDLGARRVRVRRRIRIGTAFSTGVQPLVRACFNASKLPEPIELEMTTENTYDLLEKLNAGVIDAAIVPDEVHDTRVSFVPLLEDQVALVCGKKWAGQTSLAEIPLITYPRDTPMRALVDRICMKEELDFKCVFSVPGVEAIRLLCLSQVGAAFIHRSLIEADLASGALILPPVSFRMPKLGVLLAVRGDEAGEHVAGTLLKLMEIKASRAGRSNRSAD